VTPLLSTALLRTQSDARLAGLAADGHELAFEAIVERYRRQLHGYCRRMLPDARAEDVVQQTFLSAWTALQRGDDVRELRGWLYRIAHNTAINNLKRAGYDYDELRESLEHGTTPEADLERRTVIRETLAGVAALPDNQREALLRTAVGGSSQAEIARDLGVTDGAVRQLVHRARATLRAAATAVTPFPLAAWAATAGSAGGPAVSERIGELAAGAGTAGVGSLLFKGGAAVVVAGAIAAPATVHHVHSDRSEAQAAETPKVVTQPAERVAASTPVVDRSGSGDGGGEDRHQSGKSGKDGKGEDRSGRGGGADEAGDDHGASGPSGDDHKNRAGDDGEHHAGRQDDVRSGPDHRGKDDSSGSGGDDETERVKPEDHSGPGSDDKGDEQADKPDKDNSGSDDNSGSGSGKDGSGSDDEDPHD
jgi:RNA polymerase sigma factor (sigma-70 family)